MGALGECRARRLTCFCRETFGGVLLEWKSACLQSPVRCHPISAPGKAIKPPPGPLPALHHRPSLLPLTSSGAMPTSPLPAPTLSDLLIPCLPSPFWNILQTGQPDWGLRSCPLPLGSGPMVMAS